MITILLNDKPIPLAEPHSLETLLSTNGYTGGHFAVAINKTFIPKSRYANTLLQEGDHIEVLSPMQGG